MVIAVPAWHFMRPVLRQWRTEQALEQAREYAADQDYRNLALSLRRASQLAPGDADTWREIASHLSTLGMRETVLARENVLKLDPGNLADRIHLASDALRFGEATIARNALSRPNLAAPTDADFQRISATLAFLLGDTPAMLDHLETLIALEPENSEARFHLAMVQLLRTGSTQQPQALDSLRQLLVEPSVRVRAALELLKDAGRQRDADAARKTFDLVIARLAPDLPVTAARHFEDLLSVLQSTAATTADDVARVGRWMIDIRRKTEALHWLDALPDEIRLHPSVIEVTTELVLSTDQPDRAYAQLRAGALGPISDGATLLALAARQQSLLGKPLEGRATWLDAITLSKAAEVGSLRTLVRIGSIWAEPTWVIPALQAIIAADPRAFWAYTTLRDIYFNSGQTRALWELLDRWVLHEADNELIVYEWIRYGCALPQVPRSLRENADHLLNALPPSSRLTLARAAWAWRQQNLPQAYSLIRSISASPGEMPEITYWRFLVSKALAPDSGSAHDLPDPDLPLLPEEQALLGTKN